MLKLRIDIQAGADDAADGEADDEEYRVLTVRHIIDNGVDADAGGGKTHGVEEDALLFFLETFFKQAADKTAGEDHSRVEECADHELSPFCFTFQTNILKFIVREN